MDKIKIEFIISGHTFAQEIEMSSNSNFASVWADASLMVLQKTFPDIINFLRNQIPHIK